MDAAEKQKDSLTAELAKVMSKDGSLASQICGWY
jgi:hypothetical protein